RLILRFDFQLMPKVLATGPGRAQGTEAGLALGISSINVVTDNNLLYNYILGVWRPTEQKLAGMINQALLVRKKFKQCEISLVAQSQFSYVVKLARDAIDVQIAKSRAMERRETCTICLEDPDITKVHAVEDCAHRFCFSYMKEHVKVKELAGEHQKLQVQELQNLDEEKD
ncbi:hypothetical protein EJB05_50040, partial [Eragrostis curvula]